MQTAPVGPDYEQTVGEMNRYRESTVATWRGDPARAAKIITDIVRLDDPPLRLLLGRGSGRVGGRVVGEPRGRGGEMGGAEPVGRLPGRGVAGAGRDQARIVIRPARSPILSTALSANIRPRWIVGRGVLLDIQRLRGRAVIGRPVIT